jgi:hypothetical protein
MFKNKFVQILLSIVVLLGGGYAVGNNLGGGADTSFNKIDNLTSVATTTASYCATCPVKLLSLDANRRYAVVSNVSDTAIYLYATTADLTVDGLGGTTATSTITSLNGIYVGANSNFEFNTDNMVYSNIWASSTAASKQINVNYK